MSLDNLFLLTVFLGGFLTVLGLFCGVFESLSRRRDARRGRIAVNRIPVRLWPTRRASR